MNDTYLKHKSKIDSYRLQGNTLKAASLAIREHIDGVTKGLIGEVVSDTEVRVFKLDDSKETLMLRPFLLVKDGEVSEMKGRGLGVEGFIPPGKSRGVYVMKSSGRIGVPLMV